MLPSNLCAHGCKEAQMGVWWGVRWWQGGRQGHREPFCSLWCIWSLVTSAKTVLAPGLLEFHYWSGAVQNWWGRFNTQLINPIHPFALTVNITMIMVISSRGIITIMVISTKFARVWFWVQIQIRAGVEMQKSNGTRVCTELPFNQSRISIINIIDICGNNQFIKNQHNQHMWEHPIHQESA